MSRRNNTNFSESAILNNGTYGFYPPASKTSSEFVPFGGTSSVNGISSTGNKVTTGFSPDAVYVFWETSSYYYAMFFDKNFSATQFRTYYIYTVPANGHGRIDTTHNEKQ